ncbi:nitrogen fixation protein NifQ [Azospirillum sp. TSO22-1]|uniref:nitrogen fixation protein NifQ n=1 Tax=Azospirillum sp. TSO22-1 TaxID=716789 RepID=UPI000D648B7A|nr:nitrogen fixation protein NifQ [Azospirillum sp. TSO22-1]
MAAVAAYECLMTCARSGDTADAQVLGWILLRRCSGGGAAYTRALGLPTDALAALVTTHFPAAAAGWDPESCFSRHVHRLAGAETECRPIPVPDAETAARDVERLAREERDFHDLLLRHRSGTHPVTSALAAIIARACVENDHLWRSLGLTGRSALAELLARHFHPLAAANTRKLRWKRFFYERLHAEGRPAGRARICDACSHHAECYGDALGPPSLPADGPGAGC